MVEDRKFTAENEYRIVFRNPDRDRIRFREKDGFLLPYIEIELSGQGKLPVDQIAVAPKNHMDLAGKGMMQYLDQLGYQIPVGLSRLKLRY